MKHIKAKVPKTMKAIIQKDYGDRNTLLLSEIDLPIPKEEEVLIKVKSFSINRAEILQREGKYPAPKNASPILGLECSGHLVDNGEVCEDKPVMALLTGGGYAEYATCHKSCIIPLNENIDLITAGSIPEVWLTSFQILRYLKQQGNLFAGSHILVHGAASGVGTALIQQINTIHKANAIAICGSEKKLDFCKSIGSKFGILRSDDNRNKKIMEFTLNRGVNAVLDHVGGSEFQNNISVIGLDGSLINYGLMGGAKISEVNLAQLLGKRVNLSFTTLKSRDYEYKEQLIKEFTEQVLPYLTNKKIFSVIHKVLDFTQDNVIEAHRIMEENENIGKITIRI